MSVTLLDVLVDVPDPRRAEGKRHPLPQVLLFCILANLCGAHTYKRMAAFIRRHFKLLKKHFPCDMKAPIGKSQLRDLLASLCPKGLEAAFRIHAAALEADALVGKGIDEKTTAVDGTALKGSADTAKNQRMKQMLSMFGTVGRIILAHVDIDQKTNEIPVAQELIQELGLKDRLYTFDALHCQIKTFEAANAVGSHVLVQVKDNQEGLVEAVERLAITNSPVQTCEATDKIERGRQETRRVEMFDAGPHLGLERWEPHARVALRVTRTVRKRVPGTWWRWKTTVEISWYVTNRVGRRVTYYAKAIRGHWGIENHNHRVRDGSMGEDASKIRVNPGIAARLKSFALNLGRANGIGNIQHGFWLNLQDVGSVCAMKGV
jgi:predicted transposase YbfD/YdcC